MSAHDCPLCSLSFEGAECHSACPIAKHCNLVRCPRCGYEFADRSVVVDWFRRLFKRKPAETRNILPLADVPPGVTGTVVSINAAMHRLSVYGIVPGTALRMLQRRPVPVIACGHTTIALDEDVAHSVIVRVGVRS